MYVFLNNLEKICRLILQWKYKFYKKTSGLGSLILKCRNIWNPKVGNQQHVMGISKFFSFTVLVVNSKLLWLTVHKGWHVHKHIYYTICMTCTLYKGIFTTFSRNRILLSWLHSMYFSSYAAVLPYIDPGSMNLMLFKCLYM